MSIHEIVGTVQGEITLGHLDIFMGYLKRHVNGDADTDGALGRLSRVDPRIWSMAMRHEDFKTLWDSLMVKAALGIKSMSKEQREWFKMVALRAGVFGDPNKKGTNKIVINNIVNEQPPKATADWIDPREGSIGRLGKVQSVDDPLDVSASPFPDGEA